MKLLHINASDVGSTGKIIQDISCAATAQGWESVALFPKRNRAADPNIKEYVTAFPLEQGLYRRLCRIWGHQYGVAPIATARILNILRKEKPDVVHLHCINGHCVNIYRLVNYLKKHKIPTVATNHAEFFYTGNCPHAYACDQWKTGCRNCPESVQSTGCRLFPRPHTGWKKMKKAFAGHPYAHIVSVSPWCHSRSEASPILEGIPQSVVMNGLNCNVFYPRPMKEMREKLGIPQNEKIIFHVTSGFSDLPGYAKGGEHLISLAEQLRDKNIRILVAGRHNVTGRLPENITLLGPVMDQNLLAEYYAAVDLTVVVSKRETFGMSVAESLCCGTPVVGFVSGGSESIALPQFTEFLPFGDVQGLKDCICAKWLTYKTDETSKEIAQAAEEKYAAAVMAKGYLDVYKVLLSDKESEQKSGESVD